MSKPKDKRPVLYISSSCKPCAEVKVALKDRLINRDLEVVDIDTDEGFESFYNDVLSKQDGKIPCAFKDNKPCLVGFDDEKILTIQCPTDPKLDSEPAETKTKP
jgi:glutaredoxin